MKRDMIQNQSNCLGNIFYQLYNYNDIKIVSYIMKNYGEEIVQHIFNNEENLVDPSSSS